MGWQAYWIGNAYKIGTKLTNFALESDKQSQRLKSVNYFQLQRLIMNLTAARISIITFLFLSFPTFDIQGQDIYKTPSGEKYHLSSCRMVVNVSKKLVNEPDISKYGLQPCKICRPPVRQSLVSNYAGNNKASGESNAVQCLGYTKQGIRCEHKTRIANGYCYQHTNQQNGNDPSTISKVTAPVTTTSICGTRTKSGEFCQRKVTKGGQCYQHH